MWMGEGRVNKKTTVIFRVLFNPTDPFTSNPFMTWKMPCTMINFVD